jgi:hypothetical protein
VSSNSKEREQVVKSRASGSGKAFGKLTAHHLSVVVVVVVVVIVVVVLLQIITFKA